MKKTLQFSISFFLILFLLISCNMPSDPFKNPSNSKVKLFLKQNVNTIPFGSEIKIGVSIFLAEHIKELHIYTSNNGLDSIHSYNSKAVDDTLYFFWEFLKEGDDTVFITARLENQRYKDKADSLPVFILPAPDSIRFDSIPEPLHTVVGKKDTLVFVASARSEKSISFSVESIPPIDSTSIGIKKSDDTARVIFSPKKTGKYGLTIYAKRDTLIDSATVDIAVYEPLEFENVIILDSVTLGKTDTIVFLSPKDRGDSVSYELINLQNFQKNEISVLTETADSFVIVFTPETKGTHEFIMLLTNGYLENKLRYEVFVFESIKVWNTKEKSVSAIEGKEVTVDLKTLINKSVSSDINLSTDYGIIEKSIWKWIPPWGCDNSKAAIITAFHDEKEHYLNLYVSISEGDTVKPDIKLFNSSWNDTIIGSSQIEFKVIVRDSESGISLVKLAYNSKIEDFSAKTDSIYSGFIKGLQHGEKTEIKITATDNSMEKNFSELTFYITYDSTLDDNVPPVIEQVSGPLDGARITDGQILLSFSITDDSGVDSVYWTLDSTFQGTLAQKDSIYTLSGTFDEYKPYKVEIFAVDKSVNRNQNLFDMDFDYNTEITDIIIISPEDKATGIDTSGITFKWSGGKDEDKDDVFVEIYYGVSESNLNDTITGENCDSLVLTQILKSYTNYYWQITAYSKLYSDTLRSGIYSFKTTAIQPKIASQPKENIDLGIGEKIVLRVSATGNPIPLYRWIKDGKEIQNGREDSLVIGCAALKDSGGYVVETYNEIGTDISNKVDLRVIYPVKITAGNCRSFILKNDSSLWACGANIYGELGNNTTDSILIPEKILEGIQEVAVGRHHSLILKCNGTLLACGANFQGQLGIGNTENSLKPVEVMNNVQKIAAGASHSLILKKDGTLFTCGNNSTGQLGDSTVIDKNKPLEIMKGVCSISAGEYHSLILKNNGTLLACGYNHRGQLGDNTTIDKSIPVVIMSDVKSTAAGEYHSLILKINGTLFTCGENAEGQLGISTKDSSIIPVEVINGVKTVAAGPNYSMLLKDDYSLWACGSNLYGQMGKGTTEYKNSLSEIMKNVTAVAAGDNHALILKNDGTLWACGSNFYGQLGDGTTENRLEPVRIIPGAAEL